MGHGFLKSHMKNIAFGEFVHFVFDTISGNRNFAEILYYDQNKKLTRWFFSIAGQISEKNTKKDAKSC